MNLQERYGLLSDQDFIGRTMMAARTRATQLTADGGDPPTPEQAQLAGKIMRAPWEWARVIAVGLVTVIHPNFGDDSESDPIGPSDNAFQYTVNGVVAEIAAREVVAST